MATTTTTTTTTANGAAANGVAAPRAMTPQQVQRFSRHIIMPQVGSIGQRKLMDASVLLVGAGGLGSPLAMYLAAAGVGKIGIVDFDDVDITNLHRQLLHGHDDIGRPKVDSAEDTANARTMLDRFLDFCRRDRAGAVPGAGISHPRASGADTGAATPA